MKCSKYLFVTELTVRLFGRSTLIRILSKKRNANFYSRAVPEGIRPGLVFRRL